MKKAHQILIVVGIFYAIYILLFLAKFDFNPSATIELSKNYIHEYNGTLPSGLVVQINKDGYDGHNYYMIATDIFLNRYQARRIGTNAFCIPHLHLYLRLAIYL